MKVLKKHGLSGYFALKTPRFQPDYNDEVSSEQLEAMRQAIDSAKTPDFSLTPICEPGW